MIRSTEDEANRRYEAAEEAFLAAIRADDKRSSLTALADEVAARADEWNAAAYRELHAAQGERRAELDFFTERTELLQQLWTDIAGAFHGRPARRDG